VAITSVPSADGQELTIVVQGRFDFGAHQEFRNAYERQDITPQALCGRPQGRHLPGQLGAGHAAAVARPRRRQQARISLVHAARTSARSSPFPTSNNSSRSAERDRPGELTALIADDNAADRLLLSTIVSRQGHRVLTAANGAEARPVRPGASATGADGRTDAGDGRLRGGAAYQAWPARRWCRSSS
jgi:hypothetical protein